MPVFVEQPLSLPRSAKNAHKNPSRNIQLQKHSQADWVVIGPVTQWRRAIIQSLFSEADYLIKDRPKAQNTLHTEFTSD